MTKIHLGEPTPERFHAWSATLVGHRRDGEAARRGEAARCDASEEVL
jgi:hypothetical protein